MKKTSLYMLLIMSSSMLHNAFAMKKVSEEGAPKVTSQRPHYVHETPCLIPDDKTYDDASKWVKAVKLWIGGSFARDSIQRASKFYYQVEFGMKDDFKKHETLISATPFFMVGDHKVTLDPLVFHHQHKASDPKTIIDHNMFYYNGNMLYHSKKKIADYTCFSVEGTGIQTLGFNRTFKDLANHSRNEQEIGCLALKTISEPEGADFPQGFYAKVGENQLDSHFIYSDGRSYYMTRCIDLICEGQLDDETKYIFQYIVPTKQTIEFKEELRIISKIPYSQGLSPKGLYQWKEKKNKWCEVDPFFKFTGIPFQIKSSDGNNIIKDVDSDPTTPIDQIILDYYHSPYLPTLSLSGKKIGRDTSYFSSFSSSSSVSSITIPVEVLELTRLTALNINDTALKTIPNEICSLRSLTTLNLNDNALTTIPNGLSNLTMLTGLYLRSNQLNDFPIEILNLTNLRVLNLSGNKLKSLPDEFPRLIKLVSLICCNNNLVSLPEKFPRLTSLTHLRLGNNYLQSLPAGFEGLSSLTYLDLSKNSSLYKKPWQLIKGIKEHGGTYIE